MRSTPILALIPWLFASTALAALKPTDPDYSWLFDSPSGTTAVAQTGGVNGTLENSATFVTDTPFAYAGNHAVNMPSVASNVNLTGHSGFEFVNSTFTVSMWMKIPATAARMILLAKASAEGGFDAGNPLAPNHWAYQLEIYQTTSHLAGAVLTASNRTHYERQNSGTFVDNNTWRHVAVIFSTVDLNGPGSGGGGDVRLFIDGVELATILDGTDQFQDNALYNGAPGVPLRLGARGITGGTTAEASNGLIGTADELAIWNRALSISEIQWLASNSLVHIPEPASLMLLGVGVGMALFKRRCGRGT